ncbi:HNH endonuclease signature motif containing protein [Arthrobacter sp. FB24]|uniref:HNH endonuclease signature motif containing protein n=1 Tax=Arthrobacter sp. (strain FB24) TaxID=290399 RepID=UPI00030B396C|nr:HNH endonuclease signature motif containing protein [Arthrobacter sp. FB24]
MDGKAVAETLEAMGASLAALAACAGCGAGRGAGNGAGNLASSGADPLRDEADACLDGLAGVGGLEAMLAALKVHFAAGYVRAAAALTAPAVSPQERTARAMAVTAEVACVLTVSERSAAALLADSVILTTRLPLTLSALRSGGISWQHARVMCDETSGLDPVAAAALEGHFLDPEAPFAARGCPAGELVPGRFRAKARSWRERHHPVSLEARHRKAVTDRRLDYAPDRDGMAWLSAYVSADVAAGVWARATDAARALQGPAESRTLTQLRADVAADWLIAGIAEGVPSPKAQVLVTVPVLSLLGAGTEPATLDGYGPVPPSMARRLLGEGAGSFLRVLTDPRSGAPLEIGRSSYPVPKAMRQWLRLRDGRCPFPGCNNHSLDNEADHLLAWSAGGGTDITNLGQPCPKHHRLKHTTAWTPVDATRDQPPRWISPAGRSYPSEQQDWEPPHWPDLPAGAEPAGENPAVEDDDPGWVPEWEPPHWPDLPAGAEGSTGATGPGETGPPLPADPFPDWALFIAA